MSSSSSGCSSGSPPLNVMMDVPSRARWSIRRFITSVGTGFEKSSYSLQYVHERLQRRIGMICANMGWSVETRPLAIILSSRRRRFWASSLRRTDGDSFRICPDYYNILARGAGKERSLCGEFPPVNGAGLHPGGCVRTLSLLAKLLDRRAPALHVPAVIIKHSPIYSGVPEE